MGAKKSPEPPTRRRVSWGRDTQTLHVLGAAMFRAADVISPSLSSPRD